MGHKQVKINGFTLRWRVQIKARGGLTHLERVSHFGVVSHNLTTTELITPGQLAAIMASLVELGENFETTFQLKGWQKWWWGSSRKQGYRWSMGRLLTSAGTFIVPSGWKGQAFELSTIMLKSTRNDWNNGYTTRSVHNYKHVLYQSK